MSTPITEAKIVAARLELADKLTELRTRVKHARALASPDTYWQMPAVRFGIGLAAGYLIGRPGRSSGAPAAATSPGILHAVVRAALSAGTTALVRRALLADRHEITVDVTDRQ
jgi:hypothetical protein